MLAEASSTEVEGGRGSDATKAFLGRLSLLPGGDRFDDRYRSDSIWLCVSCYNCSYRCPSNIPITDRLIASLREELLAGGVGVPPELQAAFEKTARYGNPLGGAPQKRDAWTKEAGVEVPVLEAGGSAAVLGLGRWVGCPAKRGRRGNGA